MNVHDLFKNYPLNTDSNSLSDYSDYSDKSNHKKQIQKGGTSSTEPNGGFLPIYVCKVVDDAEKVEQINREEKAKREYDTHKTSISIKALLEARRKKATIKT